MKRILVPAALLAACVMWSGAARQSLAQPVLQRLEDRIRQQGGAAAAANPGAGVPAAGERPYLGAVVDDKADRGRGVRVMEVRPGGPADRAGLRVRDLVTGAAGIRIRQMSDLTAIIDTLSPGDKLALEVSRDGRAEKAEVTLGRRTPPAGVTAEPPPEAVPPPSGDQLLTPPGGMTMPPIIRPPADGPTLTPPPPAFPPTRDDERIEQLKRRIEQLERRVEELERALAGQRKP